VVLTYQKLWAQKKIIPTALKKIRENRELAVGTNKENTRTWICDLDEGVSCHHGIAQPRVADGRYGTQIHKDGSCKYVYHQQGVVSRLGLSGELANAEGIMPLEGPRGRKIIILH
jgi:hypothetical protein